MNKVPTVFIIFAALTGAVEAQPAQPELTSGFQAPPASARMWADWFWINDNVDQESITADLEAMKAQGYGGASVFGIHSFQTMEHGPKYMSPEWAQPVARYC